MISTRKNRFNKMGRGKGGLRVADRVMEMGGGMKDVGRGRENGEGAEYLGGLEVRRGQGDFFQRTRGDDGRR